MLKKSSKHWNFVVVLEDSAPRCCQYLFQKSRNVFFPLALTSAGTQGWNCYLTSVPQHKMIWCQPPTWPPDQDPLKCCLLPPALSWFQLSYPVSPEFQEKEHDNLRAGVRCGLQKNCSKLCTGCISHWKCSAFTSSTRNPFPHPIPAGDPGSRWGRKALCIPDAGRAKRCSCSHISH